MASSVCEGNESRVDGYQTAAEAHLLLCRRHRGRLLSVRQVTVAVVVVAGVGVGAASRAPALLQLLLRLPLVVVVLQCCPGRARGVAPPPPHIAGLQRQGCSGAAQKVGIKWEEDLQRAVLQQAKRSEDEVMVAIREKCRET